MSARPFYLDAIRRMELPWFGLAVERQSEFTLSLQRSRAADSRPCLPKDKKPWLTHAEGFSACA